LVDPLATSDLGQGPLSLTSAKAHQDYSLLAEILAYRIASLFMRHCESKQFASERIVFEGKCDYVLDHSSKAKLGEAMAVLYPKKSE
jgi:hypothetical protein